jgi:lipopolysaccharide transport system ATP-binding protein
MKAAIRVENLAKQYQLGTAQAAPYRDIREAIWDVARLPVRRLARALRREQAPAAPRLLWALQDVSFEIQPGEVVGIIGRNGAGKSTLLKILSRIVEPTSGRAVVRGRMGSLLEVGTGFHPDLTGRENIFMNGSLLGMGRREIQQKLDAIVAFSEIEQFLDTPVKRYSSGMYVRLAFAVAAHLEPEILVVDEVLAVGDSDFQAKCIGKMGSVASSGRTIIFVSHNLPQVQRLCQRAILLANGRILQDGPTADVIETYLQKGHSSVLAFGRHVDFREARRWGGSGEARVANVTMFDPSPQPSTAAFRGGDLGFRLTIDGDLASVKACAVQITDWFDRKLINVNTLEHVDELVLQKEGSIELIIRDVNLRPGTYKVGFWLGASETKHLDVVIDHTVLEVLAPVGSKWFSRYDGFFRCPFEYKLS